MAGRPFGYWIDNFLACVHGEGDTGNFFSRSSYRLGDLRRAAPLAFIARHYARSLLDDLIKVTQFFIDLARSFVSGALSIRRALKSASTFIKRIFPEGRHGDDLRRQFQRQPEPTTNNRSSGYLGEFAYSQIVAALILMMASSGFALYFAYQINRLERQQAEFAAEPFKKGDLRSVRISFDQRYNLCEGADCGIGDSVSICDHRTPLDYLSFSFFCAHAARQLDLLD